MTIRDLEKGERAVVLTVNATRLVKERLRVLGIFTGEKIRLLKVSLKKSTYMIAAERSGAKLAIDAETAEGVRVWRT